MSDEGGIVSAVTDTIEKNVDVLNHSVQWLLKIKI